MKFKSYLAESVEVAVSTARLELGPEAMLVSSRRTSPGDGRGAEYEVVFASADPEPSFARELSRVAGTPSPTVDRLAQEIADLKRQVERTAAIFHRAGSFPGSDLSGDPEFFRCFSALLASGLDAGIANDLLSSIRESGEAPALGLKASVRKALEQLVVAGDREDEGGTLPKIMALVGPPGAGKTTTLVKLAVARGLALRKRVHLVSTDTHRVGGPDLLRSYAAILGVGFELAHRTAALCESLQAHSHCDVILIDTPGFDFRHQDLMREIAKALAADPKIETHLVLPASVRATSLRKLALAYEPFQPSKTIFTKLDEADTYGALVNYAFWSRKPVSFLTDGQSIPEDLRMATPAEIADLVLGREPEARAAAA